MTVHYDTTKKEIASLGSVSNEVSIGGTGWLYPENAVREDGVRSQAEMQFGDRSYYIRPNNFGFKIPEQAKINGIILEIKRSADGPDAIKDYSIRLFTGGLPAGADRAKEDAWPAQDEFKTYGGTNDTWGITLSPKDINNPAFGVGIAARNGGSALGSTTPQSQGTITAPSTVTPATINPVSEAGPEDIESLIKQSERNPRGTHVATLQKKLIEIKRGPAALELANAKAMGYYGPITKRAVAEWRGASIIVAQEIATPSTPIVIPENTPTIAPTLIDEKVVQNIPIPLLRGDSNENVRILQRLVMQLNVGPKAKNLRNKGANGVYGPLTEEVITELQNKIIDALKGPEAWRLARALLKYPKGSWGEATRAATIEYMQNLR
jgi:peptidoglycan hydrolase-like protein with peptidoglycan-binding domain